MTSIICHKNIKDYKTNNSTSLPSDIR